MAQSVTLLGCGDGGPIHGPIEHYGSLVRDALLAADIRFDGAFIARVWRLPTRRVLPFAQIYAYRTDVFKGAKPNSWADFWDATKFPGARTMPAGSGGLAPDLEAATLAMGVPLDKVYPIDIDKAYASSPRSSRRSSNGGRRARSRRRC
jgi:hypothetical protein